MSFNHSSLNKVIENEDPINKACTTAIRVETHRGIHLFNCRHEPWRRDVLKLLMAAFLILFWITHISYTSISKMLLHN